MEDRSYSKKFRKSEKPGKGRKPFRAGRRDEERSFESGKRNYSGQQEAGEQERKSRYSNRRGEEIQDPRTRNKVGNRNRRKEESGERSNFQNKGGERSFSTNRKSKFNKDNRSYRDRNNDSGSRKRSGDTSNQEFGSSEGKKSSIKKRNLDRETLRKSHYSKKKQLEHHLMQPPKDGMVRLNKFIANTGICSRREADQHIAEGRISINGKVVTEVGTKVSLKDDVRMDNKRLTPEAKVYLVLNKPKDFVTTMDDPMGRKTVMSLIENACSERVYPVGRLDRMTTGVLLFTNDGELTKKLTHPSYNKKKIYHVFLNNPISKNELQQIADGFELEDGFIQSDAISYVDPNDKRQVGIEIHSGKNRIVRRIFEHLGYNVDKLDRVFFAGITKKNLPRGRWRFLSADEIKMLQTY